MERRVLDRALERPTKAQRTEADALNLALVLAHVSLSTEPRCGVPSTKRSRAAD
jgi:hypothetical protein